MAKSSKGSEPAVLSSEVKIREPISDEEFLATLGYKQELRREFTPIEVFGVGFSIIGIFPSIRSV
jgi:hypothetical protein